MYTRTPYPNELYHHGIKGQKWGVRRYQRPDGKLTEAGQKRYHKRLVEKAVIIGGQAKFANARAENAKKKYERTAKKATVNPTDKTLRKEKERKRVYDALQKEANAWNKLTDKSIKEARANADTVRKKYSNVKLSRIPEDTKEAGKMYVKRLYWDKTAWLGAFVGGPLLSAPIQGARMRNDRKIAEYFREHPRG